MRNAKKYPLNRIGMLALALLAAAFPTIGKAATWTGATSTDWFDTTNWNPASLPTEANDVTAESGNIEISQPGALTYKLTLDTINNPNNVVALSISNGGTLTSYYRAYIGSATGSSGTASATAPTPARFA